jgi:hypothetical protein
VTKFATTYEQIKQRQDITIYIIVKKEIVQNQMDIILKMFKLLDIDIDIKKGDTAAQVSILPFQAGRWQYYDVDGMMLCKKARGICA